MINRFYSNGSISNRDISVSSSFSQNHVWKELQKVKTVRVMVKVISSNGDADEIFFWGHISEVAGCEDCERDKSVKMASLTKG